MIPSSRWNWIVESTIWIHVFVNANAMLSHCISRWQIFGNTFGVIGRQSFSSLKEILTLSPSSVDSKHYLNFVNSGNLGLLFRTFTSLADYSEWCYSCHCYWTNLSPGRLSNQFVGMGWMQDRQLTEVVMRTFVK